MDSLPFDPTPVDVPISLYREYADQFYAPKPSINQPFVPPEDQLRESMFSTRHQFHMVRADEIPYDDEALYLIGEQARFPIGAAMAQGSQNPLDDYRLIFDGTHA